MTDWAVTPHTVAPEIATAVARIEQLLPSKRGVPIISRRDIELAGFDYDLVMEAGKVNKP